MNPIARIRDRREHRRAVRAAIKRHEVWVASWRILPPVTTVQKSTTNDGVAGDGGGGHGIATEVRHPNMPCAQVKTSRPWQPEEGQRIRIVGRLRSGLITMTGTFRGNGVWADSGLKLSRWPSPLIVSWRDADDAELEDLIAEETTKALAELLYPLVVRNILNDCFTVVDAEEVG